MQRSTKPVSYIEVSGGTVTPGSILTYAGGGVGTWKSLAEAFVLDPSGTNTVHSILAAYNSLVWNLYQSGLIVTAPRVWFGAAGADGVQLSLTGAPLAAAYVPYFGAGGAYSYISMSEVLSELNGMLGDTPAARFQYENGRVNLIVKSGTSIQFDENPAAYGSTRRMMNRLFLRDISGYIGVPLTGPLLIQGQLITAPTYGVFPEPAPATNLQFGNQTADSFDATWAASPTPGAAYYVRVEGRGVNKLLLTSSLSITLGTTNGLQYGEAYTITIITTTPYEVSTSGNPSDSKSIIIVFPTFTLSAQTPYYNYIDLTWTYVGLRYSMIIQIDTDAPLRFGASLGAATITKSNAGTYNVTAYLDDNGYTGAPQSMSVEVLAIPTPVVTVSNNSNMNPSSSILFSHTPPVVIANIQNIIVSTVVGGNTVSIPQDVNNQEVYIVGLNAATTYSIEFYYMLSDGTTVGQSTILSATTAQELLFGPVYDNKQYDSEFAIFGNTLPLFPSPNPLSPSIYGFRIPTGSPYIGYTCNFIKFNGNQTTGTVTALNQQAVDSFMSVKVYSGNPFASGTTLIAQGNSAAIQSKYSETDINAKYSVSLYVDLFTGVVDEKVTITENMHIIFEERNNRNLTFLAFTSPYGKIIGIQNESADSTTIIDTVQTPLISFESY